jgi:hypothetical protein
LSFKLLGTCALLGSLYKYLLLKTLSSSGELKVSVLNTLTEGESESAIAEAIPGDPF